jgi:hypothetical protein
MEKVTAYVYTVTATCKLTNIDPKLLKNYKEDFESDDHLAEYLYYWASENDYGFESSYHHIIMILR